MNSDVFAQVLLSNQIKRITNSLVEKKKRFTHKKVFELSRFFVIESLLQRYYREDKAKKPNQLFKLFLGEAIIYLDKLKYSLNE